MEHVGVYEGLIIRHLVKETSPEEEELLRNWLAGSEDHRKLYQEIERIWELTGTFDPAFTKYAKKDFSTVAKRLSPHPSPGIISFKKVYRLAGAVAAAYTHLPHNGLVWNMPTWNRIPLGQAVRVVHEMGYQCAFHCIGDAAVDLALDAIEYAMNRSAASH